MDVIRQIEKEEKEMDRAGNKVYNPIKQEELF
jgi:hypothetical protein